MILSDQYVTSKVNPSSPPPRSEPLSNHIEGIHLKISGQSGSFRISVSKRVNDPPNRLLIALFSHLSKMYLIVVSLFFFTVKLIARSRGNWEGKFFLSKFLEIVNVKVLDLGCNFLFLFF